MRYTEARLSRFSELLLSELGQGTRGVDAELRRHYEGARGAARPPAASCNGVTGIAVGMATDIPPTTRGEVAHACVELLDNPNAGLNDLDGPLQGRTTRPTPRSSRRGTTSAKSTRPAGAPSSSERCGAKGWRHCHHGAAPIRPPALKDHGADRRPDGGQEAAHGDRSAR